ncbi:MAG: alkaline phosphatase D family protein [Ilumatobacteraceae bacterium]
MSAGVARRSPPPCLPPATSPRGCRLHYVGGRRIGGHRPGPLRPLVNPDQWDGYPRERELLLELVRESGVGGVLGLSGDLHATFVRTVDDDTGPVFPEITTPSTMSTPFGRHATKRSKGLLRPALLERLLRRQNRGIEYLDTMRRGCTVLDVGPDTIEVTIHLGVDTDEPETLRWTITHDDPIPHRR